MNVNDKSKLGRICFYLSLLEMVYFMHLLLLYYLHIDTRTTSMIREFFTIPFLFGGVVLIILSIIAYVLDKFSFKSYSFMAINIMTLTVLMLIFATYY
jgi:hypothetical protein